MIGSIFIEVLLTRWERSLCFGLNLYSLIRMGTAKHDQTKCLKQTWNETEIEHKQRLKSQSKKWRCQMNRVNRYDKFNHRLAKRCARWAALRKTWWPFAGISHSPLAQEQDRPRQIPSIWWGTSIPQKSRWRQWSFRGQAHDQSLLDDHRQPSSSCRPWRVSSLSERRDESKVRILIERIVNWNWGPTRGIKIMLPDLVVPQSLNRTSLLNICYLPWMINQNCCIWIFLSKLWLTRLPLGVVFFLFLLLGRLFLQLSLELVDLKRQEWKRLENYCTQKRWK